MYCREEGVTVGQVLYAEENPPPLVIDQLRLLLASYDEHTEVSGLNININKTTALCINTSAPFVSNLNCLQ